ncbi:MAG: prephenate dehydratase [Bacteroidetes bacterium]|nr:prephenate dehydratase [Bacteroidota bacterium]
MKSETINLKQNRVAIQGAHGSFHELAGMKYFGENIQSMECVSFKDVFNLVMNDKADFGITAIENTVAGTILPNYAMLRESGVKIIGEVYLHIQQNLLSLKGQTIADIKEVHSHPMAILQCQTFFEQYPHIKLIEADDTASRARWISENNLKSIGAIAGIHVADIYNLQALAESIETHKKNFTRFLVIRKDGILENWNNGEQHNITTFQHSNIPDKSSICFNVTHSKGSLASVLTKLAEHDINLTKIQSLPLIGKEWEYYIHIDMEFEGYDNYQNALSAIKPSLNEFKILGEYKRGNKFFEN